MLGLTRSTDQEVYVTEDGMQYVIKVGEIKKLEGEPCVHLRVEDWDDGELVNVTEFWRKRYGTVVRPNWNAVVFNVSVITQCIKLGVEAPISTKILRGELL